MRFRQIITDRGTMIFGGRNAENNEELIAQVRDNEEEGIRGGVIFAVLGLFMLILGNTIYNFLDKYGLLTFAQDILKIVPSLR